MVDKMNLAEALRKIIEDPEDLTQLPAIIAQAQELEDSVTDYQERIGKLQRLNKEYLDQIPVVGNSKQEEPEEEEATFEQAQQELLKAMQNIR